MAAPVASPSHVQDPGVRVGCFQTQGQSTVGGPVEGDASIGELTHGGGSALAEHGGGGLVAQPGTGDQRVGDVAGRLVLRRS